MSSRRIDTRRRRADGKVLGSHHGDKDVQVPVTPTRHHQRESVSGAFGGKAAQEPPRGNGGSAVPTALPVPAYVPAEPGPLSQALDRMCRAGFRVEAFDIVLAIRIGDLSLADGSHFAGHRELLLEALHRRGPFASEPRDFRTPRGYVQPAV